MVSPEPILLTTSDGVRLAGAYRSADHPRGQALLLHMMPAAKESWSAFASALAERGIASLAIDLRGHGASTGGPDGYKSFSEAEQQAKRLDVEAGLVWLRGKHPGLKALIAGASIGANLAIRAASEHADLAVCLALSPGLDYRGVTTADALPRLHAGQRLLLAVSDEDDESAKSVEALEEAATPAEREIRRLTGAGHGTTMLERDRGFFDAAVAWLASAV